MNKSKKAILNNKYNSRLYKKTGQAGQEIVYIDYNRKKKKNRYQNLFTCLSALKIY